VNETFSLSTGHFGTKEQYLSCVVLCAFRRGEQFWPAEEGEGGASVMTQIDLKIDDLMTDLANNARAVRPGIFVIDMMILPNVPDVPSGPRWSLSAERCPTDALRSWTALTIWPSC
jgi:hypothetical protein